jgi:hypothetical protein
MPRKTWPLVLCVSLPILLVAYGLLAYADQPAAQPGIVEETEALAPEAPLDAEALGQLKQRLGHKPFEGTLFQAAESLSTAPLGKSPSLLKAAHLLDEAAYVLEQAELFPKADEIRIRANELRAQAKHARHAADKPPENTLRPAGR